MDKIERKINPIKTSNEEIFNLFVKDDKDAYCELRPFMLKPFEFNGKVYATDGFALISTDKKNIDFILDNEYEPSRNTEEIIPHENISEIINIEQSLEWFERFKTEDEFEKEYCAECEGHGTTGCLEIEKRIKYDICHRCDGDGYIEVKTGNKIFSNHYVKFKDSCISIKLFYKLIQVRDFTNKEIELIYYSEEKSAILFRVGIFNVLLMPVLLPYLLLDDIKKPVLTIY